MTGLSFKLSKNFGYPYQDMIKHNNAYNKQWCEEQLAEWGGFGGNQGKFTCKGTCSRD